jgi:methylmalonyl-CoA carboxyltransferase 1.3S subunit
LELEKREGQAVKLKITVDAKTYEVDVEVAEQPIYGVGGYVPMAPVRVPAPMPISASPIPAPAAGAGAPSRASVNEEKVCRSPISGTVVRIIAKAGQRIQPNDLIVVLEAMKMETNITAPIEGTVKAINVNPGESVQGGQVVVEFE